MVDHTPNVGVARVLTHKPLQTSKFLGILLTLVLGIAGFLRIIDARGLVDDPLLGDGQFLALILIPLLSVGLVGIVFLETLVTGYRLVTSGDSLTERIGSRTGYLALRGIEAGISIIGVCVIGLALPTLVAESTPAPAGVGIMLLLMAVGLGILVTSFIRSAAELFVYRNPA